MRTEEAARRWIDGWQRAWPARDVEDLAALYGDGAPYRSHPFREADSARVYLTRAFEEEDLVEAWFGEPVVAGDRAAVEYWAILRSREDGELTIAGATFLRFDPEGLVVEHRDYWDQIGEARTPPAGWGR